MSIAVSVTIHPSRLLHSATLGLCVAIVMIGGVVGLTSMGDFSFVSRVFIIGASIISALFAIFQFRAQRKTFRLDISGNGSIRLMQYGNTCTAEVGHELNEGDRGEAVRLIDGSTLWSSLMLLHLQAEDGRISVLRILPDSVSAEEFRTLSVACRWIAARTGDQENTLLSE